MFKEDDEEEEEQRCLTGVPCLRVATGQKDELARIFGDYEGAQQHKGRLYNLTCCYGYSIDLMENVANDLEGKFQVSVVADGHCELGLTDARTVPGNAAPKGPASGTELWPICVRVRPI